MSNDKNQIRKMRDIKPTVAIIGASKDPNKFGNKAIHAYLSKGYIVYPVHPREKKIEGLVVYHSVLDIPVALDRVTFYLPPELGLQVIEEVARKGAKEIFLNPGAESDALVERAKSLGLDPILACSITAVKNAT